MKEIENLQAILTSEKEARRKAEVEGEIWHQMAEKYEIRAQAAERELRSVTLERDAYGASVDRHEAVDSALETCQREREEAERQRNQSQEEACSLLDENEKLKKQNKELNDRALPTIMEWYGPKTPRDEEGDARTHVAVKEARILNGETILVLQERVEELEGLRRKDDLRILALRSKSKKLDKYLTLLEERAQTVVDMYKINHAEDCCVGDAIDALDTVLSEGVWDEAVPKEEWEDDIPEVLKILREEMSTKRQRAEATVYTPLEKRLVKEANCLSRFCEWVEKAYCAEQKKKENEQGSSNSYQKM